MGKKNAHQIHEKRSEERTAGCQIGEEENNILLIYSVCFFEYTHQFRFIIMKNFKAENFF